MGKYEPLAAYLSEEQADVWLATFDEIEAVLGFSLPPSAHNHREWWGNQRGGGHSQAKGWHEAGWQVWKVDLPAKRVEFRRAGFEMRLELTGAIGVTRHVSAIRKPFAEQIGRASCRERVLCVV